MYVRLVFILLFFIFSACKQSNGYPEQKKCIKIKSINSIFKEKFEIEDKIDGNFNDDNLVDEVYVIKITSTGKRYLLLTLATEDNQRCVLFKSNKAILVCNETDYKIDPYIEIKSKRNQFTISQYSKTNQDITVNATFNFDNESNNFYLEDIKYVSKDNVQPIATKTKADFGKIKIMDFNIHKNY